MSSGGSKQTVGYRYFLGCHMGLCHGPLDAIVEVQVDKRVAWTGFADGLDEPIIAVDAPALFGGEKREGGVSGDITVHMGYPAQNPDSYLQSNLGSDVPAFRGVASLVFNQCYMGNNPYLKPWKFKATRIEVTSGGLEQWYLEKASIGLNLIANDCERLDSYFTGGWTETLWATFPDFDDYFPDPDSGYEMRTTGGSIVTDWAAYDAEPYPFVDQLNYTPCGEEDTIQYALRGRLAGMGGDNTIIGHPDPHPARGSFSLVCTPLSETQPYIQSTLLRHFSQQEIDINGTSYFYGPVIRMNAIEDTDNEGHTLVTAFFQGFSSIKYWEQEITIPPLTPGEWFIVSADSIIDELELEYVGRDGSNRQQWDVYAPCSIVFCLRGKGQEYNVTHAENIFLGTLTNTTGSDGPATVVGYRGSHSSLGTEWWCMGGLNAWIAGFKFADYLPCSEREAGPSGQCFDMNPAHIIRECLTDSYWGMGYSYLDVDDNSFESAADTLFSEGMGISILWEREQPLEEFIGEILRHIDAVLYVSRDSGRFVLKLIREESPLLTLDETNLSTVENAKRPTIGELTNQVSVIYWNATTDEKASVTAHNEALRLLQGNEISTSIQYPGFTNKDIAARVAERDLKTLSTPLFSCEIVANRDAAILNVGDLFTLDWPDHEIYSTNMRVDEIDYGDGIDNSIKITALQDVFSTPALASVSDTDEEWVDPASAIPQKAVARVVTEAPYYKLVLDFGETTVNSVLDATSDAGVVLASGGRQANELNANVYAEDAFGLFNTTTVDFHPYAYLIGPIKETDTVLDIVSGKDLDLVDDLTIAQIGDELVRVDSVNQDSTGAYVSVTVGRGVLDTVPKVHEEADSNGIIIAFWGDYATTETADYLTGESVEIRLQTTQGGALLDLSDAPIDVVDFDSRAIRPYPPGDFKIDGLSYPASYTWTASHTLTWAHRDRLQQTDGNLYDHTEGDIGPEPGVSYIVEGIAIVGDSVGGDSAEAPEREKFLDVDVGTDTEYVFDIDSGIFDSNYSEPPEGTTAIILGVKSRRDGYDSWQHPQIKLQYPGFTDSVGDSIGIDSVGDSVGDGIFDSVGVAPADSVGETDPYFDDVVLLLQMEGADGSTSFIDTSNIGWTVNVNGDAQLDTAEKKYGSASALFDGVGDYLTVGTTSDFNFFHDGSPFTIEAWVNFDTINDSRDIVGNARSQTNSHKGVALFRRGTNVFGANLHDGDTSSAILSGTTSTVAGVWYHVAATFDGTTFRLFVDGVLEDSDTVGSTSGDSTYALHIGRTPFNTSWDMDGHIDGLRITQGAARYTSSFTPPSVPYPEVASDLYYDDVALLLPMNGTDGSTIFEDFSSNVFSVTANGGAQIDTAQSKFGGASGLFDGVDDYLSVPDPVGNEFSFGSGIFTFECHFRANSLPSSGDYAVLIGKWGSNLSYQEWRIELFNDGGTLKTRIVSVTGIGIIVSSSITFTTTISTGTWYHFAFSKEISGTEFRVWIDGVEQGAVAGNSSWRSAGGDLTIGAIYTGANTSPDKFFDGWIDNLRLTTGVNRYSGNFTPPSKGFPAE